MKKKGKGPRVTSPGVVVVGAAIPVSLMKRLDSIAVSEKRKRAQMIHIFIEEGVEDREALVGASKQ